MKTRVCLTSMLKQQIHRIWVLYHACHEKDPKFGPFKIIRAPCSKSNNRGRCEIWHVQRALHVCGHIIKSNESSTAKQAQCGVHSTPARQKDLSCLKAANGWRLKHTRLWCAYYAKPHTTHSAVGTPTMNYDSLKESAHKHISLCCAKVSKTLC